MPGSRHLVAPLPGGRDLSVKIFVKKIVLRSLKDRSPGNQAAGPQAARQLGGRSRLAGSSIFSEDGKSSCFICLLV